jgi:hypothetical protein
MVRIVSFLTALFLLAAGAATAQSAPDFSGTWTMNAAQSNFGGMPAPSSLTQTVTQEPSAVKVAVKQSGDFGDMAMDFTFTTDGKENANQVADMQVKSTARWDGPALVIDSTMDIQGSALTMSDRWSLSADGKQMIIDRHVTSAMGSGDGKIVFDKQ